MNNEVENYLLSEISEKLMKLWSAAHEDYVKAEQNLEYCERWERSHYYKPLEQASEKFDLYDAVSNQWHEFRRKIGLLKNG